MPKLTPQLLREELDKPVPLDTNDDTYESFFSPWRGVFDGIWGDYAASTNVLMVDVLEAIRNSTILEVIERHGSGGEMALFLLAGHEMVDYGGSPYGSWPAPKYEGMWNELIDKWKEYNWNMWGIDPKTGYASSAPEQPPQLARGPKGPR